MEREIERERDVDIKDVDIKRPDDTDARKGERGNPEDSSLPPLDQSEEAVPEEERG